MDCKKKFGEIMHKVRKSKGMTSEELANMVGVTDVYCRGIEYGRYTVSWITWLKICNALCINANDAAQLVLSDNEV